LLACLDIAACALAASFGMLLAAGIAGDNWLPMINLAAIVLVPMAVILSEVFGGNLAVSGALSCRWAGFSDGSAPRPPRVPRHLRSHVWCYRLRRGQGRVDQLWDLLLGHHPRVSGRRAAPA
jgi:hypothetical protein